MLVFVRQATYDCNVGEPCEKNALVNQRRVRLSFSPEASARPCTLAFDQRFARNLRVGTSKVAGHESPSEMMSTKLLTFTPKPETRGPIPDAQQLQRDTQLAAEADRPCRPSELRDGGRRESGGFQGVAGLGIVGGLSCQAAKRKLVPLNSPGKDAEACRSETSKPRFDESPHEQDCPDFQWVGGDVAGRRLRSCSEPAPPAASPAVVVAAGLSISQSQN